MIRPLNDRILIKPLPNAEMTESGLHLAEHKQPEQQGTVSAVGRPVHPRKADAGRLASQIEVIVDRLAGGDNDRIIEQREKEALWEAAGLLRDLVRREPAVQVGDDVLFSWTVGQELVLDDDERDQRYLLIREEDLLAVLESESA